MLSKVLDHPLSSLVSDHRPCTDHIDRDLDAHDMSMVIDTNLFGCRGVDRDMNTEFFESHGRENGHGRTPVSPDL